MKQIQNNSDTFEVIYSLFMLFFGFGMIVCFIIVVGLLFYTLGILFLLFFWPILVGIGMGVFRKTSTGYEMELESKDAQKLDKILDTITKTTEQKKPYKIIISEGSEIGVSGLFRKKLIIGLATLRLLNEKDLLAIIAHEYGHFAKKDTVLGYFTYKIQDFIEVQKEINRQNIDLDISVIIYLPTWIFFYLFSAYYSLISLWYSRKVEYRADRYAADLVGAQEFSNALIKYCVISEIFENEIPQQILYYLEQNKQLINIYEHIFPIYTEKNIKKSFKNIISDISSWWSTHPSISERFEALNIEKVEITIENKSNNFFNNQKKYEEEASEIMTYKIDYFTNILLANEEQE